MSNTLLSIQMSPKTNAGESIIPYVDEAIAVIKQSGLNYRVGPLETTIEGELSQLLQLVEKMHLRMNEIGCPGATSNIRIAHNPNGISMEQLLEKYPNGQ